MDRVFFDTSIYNHLLDQPISLHAIKSKRNIVIYTIPQVLGELAGTFEGDHRRGKELCGLFADVISGIILCDPPSLLATELYNVLHKKKVTQKDLRIDDEESFFRILNRLKDGDIDQNTVDFIKRAKENKRMHHKHAREDKARIDNLWDDEKRKLFPTFESFWDNAYQVGDVRKFIKDYLFKMMERKQIPEKALPNIPGVAKMIERNLEKFPHIGTAVKLVPAMYYRYHLQKEKPKWGDLEDTTNFIATTTLDIYVADDPEAREIFSLIFPGKKSLSLQEFILTTS